MTEKPGLSQIINFPIKNGILNLKGTKYEVLLIEANYQGYPKNQIPIQSNMP